MLITLLKLETRALVLVKEQGMLSGRDKLWLKRLVDPIDIRLMLLIFVTVLDVATMTEVLIYI